MASEAAADELVGGLPAPFPGPSMHRDAVTELPPGAVLLGETDLYPHQVFRIGEAAWGVQFHPEVSVQTFHAWRGRGRERGPRAGRAVRAGDVTIAGPGGLA